jgi:hypothetical protein
MEVVFWITLAVACCVLCGYGIYAAVRRGRERREHSTHTGVLAPR